MRAGRLDRLITIQRKTVTNSGSGEPIEAWAAIGPVRRAASMVPVRGEERFSGPQLVGNEQIEFRIRYSVEVANLTPQDRIIHPALSEDSPEDEPNTRQIHDILASHEIGRREGLQIITMRRADVTA